MLLEAPFNNHLFRYTLQSEELVMAFLSDEINGSKWTYSKFPVENQLFEFKFPDHLLHLGDWIDKSFLYIRKS